MSRAAASSGPARTEEAAVPGEVREWVSFPDPNEDRTWMFDVTFLESAWSCIYGSGCKGVFTETAPELEQGCCSYGAHFTGEDDVARVEEAASRLGGDLWQFAARARKGGIAKRSGGQVMTRLVEDACIFLNRPGFPGGAGCALHKLALKEGAEPMTTKPDVCWQLPLRREDLVDDQGHVTSIVSEWGRRHWGEAGYEFAWWCTEESDAYVGATPLYARVAGELEAMVGPTVYGLVRDHLDRRRNRPVALAPPRKRV